MTEALERAGTGLDRIDAITVTRGPGLIGSLLVGVCAAKAMAWQRRLPLVMVNHIEGHIRSAFIENPAIGFPAVALVVSGGHTTLFRVDSPLALTILGQTRDDAAGEVIDKVASSSGSTTPADRRSIGSPSAGTRGRCASRAGRCRRGRR